MRPITSDYLVSKTVQIILQVKKQYILHQTKYKKIYYILNVTLSALEINPVTTM